MKLLKTRLTLAALAFCAGLNATTLAQNTAARAAEPAVDAGNLRAYIALVRADLKTEKTLIIAQNISFTEDEAVEFWPLHSEYTLALNKLLDQRLNLLSEYATTYQDMSDKQAADLARKVFAWEEKRVGLKRTWFKKFSKVVPAKKAAQFFQIENQLNAALDLQLAAALPLIK
jgi:hypothetical protein